MSKVTRRAFLGAVCACVGTAAALPVIGAVGAPSAPPPAPPVGGGFGLGSCTIMDDGFAPWQVPAITDRSWPAAIHAQQRDNVATVLRVISERGLPQRAARISLMVVLIESKGVTDLTGLMGWPRDHTSYGIFQQQDWWGSIAEREDAAIATALFLDGKPGIPGLLSIDWMSMPDHLAAQEVQRSAHSDGSNYLAMAPHADAILACSVSAPSTDDFDSTGNWTFPLRRSTMVVTSEYGMRHHPILGITRLHAGMDLWGPGVDREPLFAASDGVVHNVFWAYEGGNVTTMAWGSGLYSNYLHQSEVLVRAGDRVQAGDHIGYMGGTAEAYTVASHLHFEIGTGLRSWVLPGESWPVTVNPRTFYAEKGLHFP